MKVREMLIEGTQGHVQIAATDRGALVTSGNRVLCEVGRDEATDPRLTKAREVTIFLYGKNARRGPRRYTNDTIFEVLWAIDQVAGSV